MQNEWEDNDICKHGSIIDIYDTETKGVLIDRINVPDGENGFKLRGWEVMQETGYFIKKTVTVIYSQSLCTINNSQTIEKENVAFL